MSGVCFGETVDARRSVLWCSPLRMLHVQEDQPLDSVYLSSFVQLKMVHSRGGVPQERGTSSGYFLSNMEFASAVNRNSGKESGTRNCAMLLLKGQ